MFVQRQHTGELCYAAWIVKCRNETVRFARNVFNCCNHFSLNTCSLWFLTPAYIFNCLCLQLIGALMTELKLLKYCWNCSVYVPVCVASTQTLLVMIWILLLMLETSILVIFSFIVCAHRRRSREFGCEGSLWLGPSQ